MAEPASVPGLLWRHFPADAVVGAGRSVTARKIQPVVNRRYGLSRLCVAGVLAIPATLELGRTGHDVDCFTAVVGLAHK